MCCSLLSIAFIITMTKNNLKMKVFIIQLIGLHSRKSKHEFWGNSTDRGTKAEIVRECFQQSCPSCLLRLLSFISPNHLSRDALIIGGLTLLHQSSIKKCILYACLQVNMMRTFFPSLYQVDQNGAKQTKILTLIRKYHLATIANHVCYLCVLL